MIKYICLLFVAINVFLYPLYGHEEQTHRWEKEDISKWPEFHRLIVKGRSDEAIALFQYNPNVASERTPFMNVGYKPRNGGFAHYNYKEGIEAAVKGTDLAKNPLGNSALELAIEMGDTKLVTEILTKVIDPNVITLEVTNVWGFNFEPHFEIQAITPLGRAIQSTDPEAMDLLLKSGTSIDKGIRKLSSEVSDWDLGITWNKTDSGWKSATNMIVSSKSDELLRTWIAWKSQIDHPDAIPDDVLATFKQYLCVKKGTPPLHLAIENFDSKAIALLLEYGEDPNEREESPLSALSLSIQLQYWDAVELLLTGEADVFEEELVMAASKGTVDLFERLIWISKVDGNLSEPWKNISNAAISSGNVETAKLLAEKGFLQTDEAFQSAMESGSVDMLEYLFDLDFEEPEVFHLSVNSGSIDLIRVVLKRKEISIAEVDAEINRVLSNPDSSREVIEFLLSYREQMRSILN